MARGIGEGRGEGDQTRRVEGWVYLVINPLLEGLPLEAQFLERNHITWRFWNESLEYLKPIAHYLTPDGRHALRDFRRKDAPVGEKLDLHDTRLEELRNAAKAAQTTLIGLEPFRAAVEASLVEYAAGGPQRPHDQGYPGGGAITKEDFPKLVAQNVINDARELPENYNDCVFWSRFGDRFFEFARGLREFEALRSARSAMLAYDQELIAFLERKSFELCERYGISPAPLPERS